MAASSYPFLAFQSNALPHEDKTPSAS